MKDVPRLSVIVVTYNGDEWVNRCLDALLGQARPTVPFEVVVVDNASQPSTRALLAGYADRVQLRLLDENIGFGRACNLGVSLSTGRDVLLLNPDAVLSPGSADALVRFLEQRPAAGIVGGRTVRPDGSTDPGSCWGAPTLWSLACFAFGLSTAFKGSRVFDPEALGGWQRDTVREVDIVSGALLLISRALWDEVQGFDEAFFMYAEDADLCIRVARIGYHPAITPDAVALHAVGGSSTSKAAKQQLLLRGKATLVRKHRAGLDRAAALWFLRLGVALRARGQALLGRQPTWAALGQDGTDWTDGWVARPTSSGS